MKEAIEEFMRIMLDVFPSIQIAAQCLVIHHNLASETMEILEGGSQVGSLVPQTRQQPLIIIL